ncbi:hypothetical protein C823_000028 [Eubacterium plexicaudatum ASF492]|nr:hypothetical protein C823_000028 [Eubacterium plexicaudatum ASF492]
MSNLNKLTDYNEIKMFLEELVKNWNNVDNEIIYYAMKKAQEISNEFEYQIFMIRYTRRHNNIIWN